MLEYDYTDKEIILLNKVIFLLYVNNNHYCYLDINIEYILNKLYINNITERNIIIQEYNKNLNSFIINKKFNNIHIKKDKNTKELNMISTDKSKDIINSKKMIIIPIIVIKKR